MSRNKGGDVVNSEGFELFLAFFTKNCMYGTVYITRYTPSRIVLKADSPSALYVLHSRSSDVDTYWHRFTENAIKKPYNSKDFTNLRPP